MTDAPTGSNADEWALFLREWGTTYCAVQIANAIDTAREEGRRAGLEEAREEVIAKIEDCRKMQANYFQRGQDAQGYHAEAAKVVLSATEAAILALTEQEGE